MTQTNRATRPRRGPVDWEFAKSTGARLVPAGPQVSATEAADVVASLREAARYAVAPVAEATGLSSPGDAPAALVVDRPRWIAANVETMSAMVDGALDGLVRPRGASGDAPSGTTSAVGAKFAGGEAGALFAFMASKVLGQYDLAPQGTPRLLLVAPNLVEVERSLEVDPEDFRRWVCMHEETHRLQFTAVPWLRDHLVGSARSLVSDIAPDAEQLTETVNRIASRLPGVVRGESSLVDLVTTPEQQARIDELTAVMSLLEGHADVMMDEVGPAHIPSVATIRRRFDNRRKGSGSVDKVLRRLLGLEAKMRQYRDGAVFVRGVVDRVGLDGFNAVWTSAETLPTPAEIEDSSIWVARVHG